MTLTKHHGNTGMGDIQNQNTTRKQQESTVRLPPELRKLVSFIAEGFRYEGKQMLSDILKWTIIIIIAVVVFVIAYKVATYDSHDSTAWRGGRVSSR